MNNQNIHIEESKREKFIKKNNWNDFKATYKKKTKNLNTGTFWNNKFSIPEKIKEQDSMTQEKIRYISHFVSNLGNNISILDVGIGQAYLEQVLKKRGVKFNLSAIDISPISINRSKKNFHARGIVDNALNMNKHFKSKSFDVIVAIEVIEHISPGKIFSFYKKVHSLLKDDGIFIISTPLNEGLRHMKENPNAHVREYTQPILEAEFKLSSFEILQTKTLIAFKKFYMLKKTISHLFPNHWKPNNIIIIARKSTSR